MSWRTAQRVAKGSRVGSPTGIGSRPDGIIWSMETKTVIWILKSSVQLDLSCKKECMGLANGRPVRFTSRLQRDHQRSDFWLYVQTLGVESEREGKPQETSTDGGTRCSYQIFLTGTTRSGRVATHCQSSNSLEDDIQNYNYRNLWTKQTRCRAEDG